ncbi:MAG: class I tRNA ligase family protein [Caldilineaceae bacterium]
MSDPIFENLKEKGLLYRIQNYTHRYPTCWRCKTELVFRLVAEWFISMGELYDKPRAEVTAEEKARSLRYQISADSVDEENAGCPNLATPARWTGCATCTTG